MTQPRQLFQKSKPISIGLKVALSIVFTGILAVGFMGYFTPAMRISWEAVASMCGF